MTDKYEINNSNECDPNRPVVLFEVVNEIEATALLAELNSKGIDALTTGEFTAGFRAEAPGLVQIVVKQQDLLRAQNILAEVQKSNAAIDWTKVDVGDPEKE